MRINGIILAAGLSSRMERFKPLLPLGDKTMIEHSADSLFRAGAEQVVVVLGHRAEEIEKILAGKYAPACLIPVYNRQYAETDMLASVKVGIAALPACDAFYLLPGDMPSIKAATFRAVKEAMSGLRAMAAFPAVDGYRKHPPLISWRCAGIIRSFNGSGGLRAIWRQLAEEIVTVPVEDRGCLLDADTPADYERLIEYMKLADQ